MLLINVAPIPVSLTQVMLASIPILILLGYFVLVAFQRPDTPCYTEVGVTADGKAPEECDLMPLEEILIIDIVICFLFLAQGLYLMFFVSRRLNLLKNYLLNGQSLLGDVHYDPNQNVCGGVPLVHYGHVVYPHPSQDPEDPVFVERKVRVFERYTRERTTLLYLNNMPFSGQPKIDLEVDLKKTEDISAREKLMSISHFALFIAFLCYLVLAYVLKVLWEMDQVGIESWQPDFGAFKTVVIYMIVGFCLPVLAFLFNWMAWFRYKWWMTRSHKVVSKNDTKQTTRYSRPLWFKSPNDMSTSTYKPPESTKSVEMKELE